MANTSKRGFASMDPSKQKEIASKGGRAAHAKGTAHEFTSDEARVAGRKGGEAVSRDRAHMSAIGREGGHSRGARARAAQSGSPSTNSPNRSASSQSFRPSNDERGASAGASFGAQERGSDSGYAGSSNRDRDRDRTRNENRSGDTPSGNVPFAGREEI
jgi:uncharacterized protein